jgi:16S rRNA (uracil1498-N3)-methyltransferase
MPRYDFTSPRLFVDAPLAAGGDIALDRAQRNYLLNVLRQRSGDAILLFNGRDGEWRSRLSGTGKRATLTLEGRTRPQTQPRDLHYLFAPLKHARLDYMVQKVVEMGVSRLQPIMTRHGQVARVNLDRMRANTIEAAEQCGILTLPEIGAAIPLERAIATRVPDRLWVFCDEAAEVKDPLAALQAVRPSNGRPNPPLAVLIGPEGGFADDERKTLLRLPNLVRLALGPRILRADTAAIAALALVQSVLGDWHAC